MGAEGRIPSSLIRNNGDGTFSDVTETSGLNIAQPTQTAVWFDYDGDGWLDLFVGGESSPGADFPCKLFHNNHDGTFTECAKQCGVNIVGSVKGVASADYDNDGRPDLFISLLSGPGGEPVPGILLHNEGPRDPRHADAGWKFSDASQKAGIVRPMRSFPCWFFDYDNDGWPDLFVCGRFASEGPGDVAADYLGLPNEGERPCLYHNNGDGTFTDVTRAAGLDHVLLGMGCNFGDLDNDGFLDFYIGTGAALIFGAGAESHVSQRRRQAFSRCHDLRRIRQLAKRAWRGLRRFSKHRPAGCLRADGVAFSGDKYYSVLYANPGHGNHWITLKLEGVRSNRSAVGGRICVTARMPGGRQSIYRTVGSGGSFGSNPLRQEIGLGDAQAIESIDIFWPATGQHQRLAGPLDGPLLSRWRRRRGRDGSALPSFQYRDLPAAKTAD